MYVLDFIIYSHLIMTFWKRRNVVPCFITFYRKILLLNILKKKGNCNFPIILEVRRGKELIGSRKLGHAQERVPRTRYLHKERKMCTVTLDAVLDR